MAEGGGQGRQARLYGLRTKPLRHKDKEGIIRLLFTATYNAEKRRAISYVKTRRLRRKDNAITT